MNSYHGDPLWAQVKCQMCPKKATNFVFGLCERCVIIWTKKSGVENMNITNEHVKAMIVRMAQNSTNYQGMDNTLRALIEEDKRRRIEKVELFQKFRENFQNGILISSQENVAHNYIPIEETPNYCDIDFPKLNMEDLLKDTRLPYLNTFKIPFE